MFSSLNFSGSVGFEDSSLEAKKADEVATKESMQSASTEREKETGDASERASERVGPIRFPGALKAPKDQGVGVDMWGLGLCWNRVVFLGSLFEARDTSPGGFPFQNQQEHVRCWDPLGRPV